MIPGTQEPKNPRTQELKIRNSKLSTFLLSSVFCILLSLSGCSQPTAPDAETSGSPDMIRRAQLVGQENIQLKKQVEALEKQAADRDKRIADLTGQLSQSKKQAADWQTRYGQLDRNMNAALLECQTALQASQTETPAEAISCEEVEAKYAETIQTLMQNLLDCSTKLEAFENTTTDSAD